jgi:hypothetical protein
MTQNRKENTHNPPLLKIHILKKSCSRLPKEKNHGVFRMHVATSHWLTKILILKFVGPHFCPILVPWVLIRVHGSVGQILNFGQVSTKACI